MTRRLSRVAVRERAWEITNESCDKLDGKRCLVRTPRCGPCLLVSQIVRLVFTAVAESRGGIR